MNTVKNAPQRHSSSVPNVLSTLSQTFGKMNQYPFLKWGMLIIGLPVYVISFIIYLMKRKDDAYQRLWHELHQACTDAGLKEKLITKHLEQQRRKQTFFQQKIDELKIKQVAEKRAEDEFLQIVEDKVQEELAQRGENQLTFSGIMRTLLKHPVFVVLTFIPGLLFYILIFLYMNPYIKYIFERLVSTLFVIIGVAFFVFTILYISPFDPAANILGVTATKEQIATFNQIYGLDQPYWVQLWQAIQGIFTFDLGASFAGNENVVDAIARKIPITLFLTFIALILAVVIAIPIGIISATRSNTFLDYTLMFVALIGLSIPNFWQGLIFILTFSIELQWLPATFTPGNLLSIIMPAVVLGTGLMASIARMTRSSTLEVIHEDYIITARAKGLNERRILWRHAFGNALIPIITVIGLMFGGMLGGAAVTEKVFNISGIGSYIVDKQFIPDIPAIMGGVVYIAITISLVNLFIDILYAFIDPRIRSKMKQY
ncbi:ABC transporter permease [Cytobacillus sp. Sa5YUA1]|uniref:ABC transporter permease n=1 Tax=Cytobacillus stercorigallinarum TaxID=2762240 RepID=A0ABR8QP41_9BACI|nr:ABC transporter permease [Cytobacillus stercorigallinarum]MBD7937299.1 ABC transporter permease [Cytobacillus stercorigallinarum]